MATARINRPTRTNRPTRNSDQVSCLLRAILRFLRKEPGQSCAQLYRSSNQKPLQIRIFGLEKFFRTTFEIDVAIAQDQKAGDRLAARESADGATANGACFGIKMKIGESETVLQAVGGHEWR